MSDELEAPLVRGESDLLVFISSVTEEMRSARRKAVQTLNDLPFSRPWAFEFTPANSEDVTDAYLRKVEEADFVVWLVGVETTQPVIDEINACIASGGRLLAFKFESGGANQTTRTLIETVSDYAKWHDVQSLDTFAECLRKTIADELVRALRDPALPMRRRRLNVQLRLSVAKCKQMWSTLGVPDDIAAELAADRDLGNVLRLPDSGVRVVVGDVGAGKTLAVSRVFQKAMGAALLRRGFFALFMGSFARGCVSPVAISGGTSSRPARTGVFSAASRASSRRRTPSVFSPTGALPSGHSRGVLVRCRGKGGRPAMAVTTGFQGRTFDVPRTCVPCIDPPRRAPCAAADAVFADAKAFLSSSEARQMSESELERELHRRGQELVRKLLQGHRDQRSPKEAAGPAEDTSGVECSEPREHESPAETASGTMQVVGLGCARRGHDGLHRLDAALNLLPERYLVEMRRRVTIATASRAPPRTPWKPPWYSTSSTWQRRRGVRCSSPAHRRACRHLVRDPMGDDRRSAAAGSRSLDAY